MEGGGHEGGEFTTKSDEFQISPAASPEIVHCAV